MKPPLAPNLGRTNSQNAAASISCATVWPVKKTPDHPFRRSRPDDHADGDPEQHAFRHARRRPNQQYADAGGVKRRHMQRRQGYGP